MKIPDNAHSVIHNYAMAGLDSYLLGNKNMRTRLFHMTRNQVDYITPHSHKYDLQCTVLSGHVINTIFEPTDDIGEIFYETELKFNGMVGDYDKSSNGRYRNFKLVKTKYFFGQKYWMPYTDIHSIWFSKDALVMIEEGEMVTDTSLILEPFSNGIVVNNFHVHDGLFTKDKSVSVQRQDNEFDTQEEVFHAPPK